jgi:hypothetical protein
MASISNIRTGIATRLATISGLRTSSFIPDNPNPPIAIVQPVNIIFDTAFRRGADTLEFTITLLVGQVSERTSQSKMDGYCATTGSTSVKAAIEGDKTLGGSCYDCRVTQMRSFGSIIVGEINYLGAEFVVSVIA